MRLILNTTGRPYRETYWRIKNTGEVNIVLDVKTENLNRALKHVSYFNS